MGGGKFQIKNVEIVVTVSSLQLGFLVTCNLYKTSLVSLLPLRPFQSLSTIGF
jgi:hypothetical protein